MRRVRRPVLIFLIFACWCSGAERWKVQYFYDKNESALEIRDFRCPSAEHCVAVGMLSFARRDAESVAVLTDDGGAHWSQVELREQPEALAFLNERIGWMATDEGVWKTADGGRKWSRLAKLTG